MLVSIFLKKMFPHVQHAHVANQHSSPHKSPDSGMVSSDHVVHCDGPIWVPGPNDPEQSKSRPGRPERDT